MCFSATASFAASGGLAMLGGDALRVAPRRLRFVAVIPLFFAVQQAIEGIQWLFLKSGQTCALAGYGFLAFAYVLWPLYIPGVVYLMDKPARPYVRWFILLGGLVAAWNLAAMISGPLAISVSPLGHVVYDLHMPKGDEYAVLYVIAVSGALLASRMTAFRIGGVLAFLTAAAALYVSWLGFASVWCFMAAVISSFVWVYVRREAKV